MKTFLKRFLIVFPVFCSAASGQEMPIGGPARERIEQFKKIRLMEMLKLDEETSIKFFARYNKHQDQLREITTKRDGLVDQLAALRKANAADAEYEKVFKEIQSAESRIIEERSKFLQDLKSVISTKQVAEYIVFERNFNRQLMQLMREMAGERGRRMGPPMR